MFFAMNANLICFVPQRTGWPFLKCPSTPKADSSRAAVPQAHVPCRSSRLASLGCGRLPEPSGSLSKIPPQNGLQLAEAVICWSKLFKPPLRGILLSVLEMPYRFSSSAKYQVREAEQFCGRSSQRKCGTAQDEAKRIFDRVTRALAAAKTIDQVSEVYDKKDKNKFIRRNGTKEYCVKAATA